MASESFYTWHRYSIFKWWKWNNISACVEHKSWSSSRTGPSTFILHRLQGWSSICEKGETVCISTKMQNASQATIAPKRYARKHHTIHYTYPHLQVYHIREISHVQRSPVLTLLADCSLDIKAIGPTGLEVIHSQTKTPQALWWGSGQVPSKGRPKKDQKTTSIYSKHLQTAQKTVATELVLFLFELFYLAPSFPGSSSLTLQSRKTRGRVCNLSWPFKKCTYSTSIPLLWKLSSSSLGRIELV